MILRQALLLLPLLTSTHAYPSGAGDCPQDEAAVGTAHKHDHNQIVTSGSLEDNDLQVFIGSTSLSEQPNGKITLEVGETYSLSLSTEFGEAFRGFLIRLGPGSNNIDTTDALSSSDKEHVHVSDRCVDEYAVGGLTHMERGIKVGITGEITIDEESLDMPLDVTVVINNRDGNSTYYYSQFFVDAVEDPSKLRLISPSPSVSPMGTLAPTADGTPDATDGDSYGSYAPMGTFDPSSTSSPTEAPSMAPTENYDVGMCGDGFAFGLDKCYGTRHGYCTWTSSATGCQKIGSTISYYNNIDLRSDLMGTVSITVNTCPDGSVDECSVVVDNTNVECGCSSQGDAVILQECKGDGLPFEFLDLPQTIQAEGGVFEIVSTDEMCSSVGTRSGAAVVPTKKAGETTKTMTIPSQLRLFFDGLDGESLNFDTPTQTELLTKTMEYFIAKLMADGAFEQKTFGLTLDSVQFTPVVGNGNTNGEVLVAFITNIELDETATGTQRQAITAIANSNWKKYIALFDSGPLQSLDKVIYKGIGRAGLAAT